jgi:hypothetical protein
MEIAANILGLAGTLALLVPAGYGAYIVRKASRLSKNANLVEDSQIERRRADAVEEILNLQNKWNWKLAFCLFGGMSLGVLSYILLLWHELASLSESVSH